MTVDEVIKKLQDEEMSDRWNEQIMEWQSEKYTGCHDKRIEVGLNEEMPEGETKHEV